MIWDVYQLPPGGAAIALRPLGRVRADSKLGAFTRAARKWPLAINRRHPELGLVVEIARQNLVKTVMRGSA